MKNFFFRTRQSFSNDTQRKIRPNRLPLPALVLAALLAIFEASPANATDLLLPTGGLVSIELLSSDAAFRNILSLVSPAAVVAVSGCNLEPAVGLTGVLLLSEKTSQHGCRVTLD